MSRERRGGPLLGGLLAMLLTSTGFAQAQISSAIDVQQYKSAPSASDVLNLHGTRVARPFDWQAGVFIHYSTGPLTVVNPTTGLGVTRLVSSQTAFDLVGSIGLYDKLEVGLHLPITMQVSEGAPFLGERFADGVQAFGLGDARVIPKYQLFQHEALGVAAALPLVLPTGASSAFLGGGGIGVQPRLLVDYLLPNDFRFIGNVGVNLRRQEQLLNLTVGNEFAFGAGAEIPLKVMNRDLAVLSSVYGNVGLAESDPEEIPVELVVAARYRLAPHMGFTLGAGRGLTAGYGTPTVRVLAGFVWTDAVARKKEEPKPEPKEEPVCTTGPEDVDGHLDDDACGDPDNDADKLEDGKDVCPDDAETKNGYRDDDGCPDQKPAAIPPLPRAPAPTDTDNDGILDAQDRCATSAEDQDSFEDADGCPEPDNDRDGVEDGKDKCPLEAETINGVTDDDGCPDKGKSKVVVRGEKIVILEKVYFATAKDEILSKSFNVLKQVAAVLKANPHLDRVRVEGHTDDQGDDQYNLDLSQKRANSVKTFLVKEGIAAERLEAVGYGETRPVDNNKTAKGRENNRRVEFTILQDEPPTREIEATPEESTPELAPPEGTPRLAPTGVDAGAPSNGSRMDAGVPSSGSRVDAGVPSNGSRMDAGVPSSGSRVDAGVPSSGSRSDAGVLSTARTGAVDGGVPPAGAKQGAPDAGASVGASDGGTRAKRRAPLDAGTQTEGSR